MYAGKKTNKSGLKVEKIPGFSVLSRRTTYPLYGITTVSFRGGSFTFMSGIFPLFQLELRHFADL